ncbi:hypothetical protein CBS101457_004646 [Exobasidium rhododendri]|nr:hypothetical protein CBS101457_004646 [Exobasidium rhododendri]
MEAEAGPSRPSTSHLDPLPASHPLSKKLRVILESTANFTSTTDSNRRALQEIEERYEQRHLEERKGRGRASLQRDQHHNFIEIDTERARNCLARDAQDSLEKACFGFLDSLQVVDNSLSIISDAMNELHDCCSEIEDQLSQADDSTRYLLQHADGLRKQSLLTSQQSALLETFLARFSLSPAQLETVNSRTEVVGPPLFAAMDRLQDIRSDCKVLLAGHDEGTKAGMRAGMDIMDETSQLLDKAHEKITKWLNFEMRSFFHEGMEVGGNVREGIKRLTDREDLLRPVLKTLASTRSQQLSTTFQRALTVGGPAPSFLPRPIELHAHDPLRYIGDMLAWVHQAVASEREFLIGLFSRVGQKRDAESQRRMGQRRRGLEGSIDWTKDDQTSLTKTEIWTREVLNKVMEGSDRLLKSRIEQTVQSQEGCITTFRLANLIQFYRITMDRTIGTRASLSKTLAEISIFAYQAFLKTLDNVAAGLDRFQQSPDADLGPPPPLLGAGATLKELLTVHQTSLSESDLFGDSLPLKDLSGSNDEVATDFSRVIARFVEPIMTLCTRMSSDIVRKRPRGKTEAESEWETSVFMINCLGYLHSILDPFEFAAETSKQVEIKLEQRLESLIESHHKILLRESGLTESRVTSDIVNSLDSFETFLSTPSLLASPRLSLLSVPTRRSAVHAKALALLASDYEALVKAEQAGDEKRKARRSPEEIQILLGIDTVQAKVVS